MKSIGNALISLVLAAALPMLPGAIAAPAVGGVYQLTGSLIRGGGGALTGGGFELVGTVAQPEADSALAGGGEFELAGGFWTRAGNDGLLFRNGFEEG